MTIHNLKKKCLSLILLCILCSAILLGCGIKETTQHEKEQPGTDAETETKILTDQELAQWTAYVNARENNGFLLSFYDRPQQIDLGELFYSGCGLDQEELSPEETKEYLELTEMEEIYTDVIRITGEQIESVLKQRLGLTPADMEKPLEWCYLAASDAYVVQHGDTNAQNFTCISGTQTGNQVILDCLSGMTGETCRVTLKLPDGKDIWMFVSNKALSTAAFDDGSFISDAAYQDVVSRLGEENALQLRTFAENYQEWLPAEDDIAPGVMNFAVYDLDGDGQPELMHAQIQGTGLYACNFFYQADVENGQVHELNQQTPEDGFALEIAQTKAYTDQQGKIFYMASDYGRAGAQFSSCTDGYYYLENGTVISKAIRSYTLEYNEKEEETYTYYLIDQEKPVTKSEWEAASRAFLDGKTTADSSICWKDLPVEEIAEKTARDWFLLLAESLEEAFPN